MIFAYELDTTSHVSHIYIYTYIYIHTIWQTNITHYGTSPFFMGKSTISIAMFNSKLLVYQRV